MAARRADHEVMYCSVWALPNTTVQNTNQYMILEGLALHVDDLPVELGTASELLVQRVVGHLAEDNA